MLEGISGDVGAILGAILEISGGYPDGLRDQFGQRWPEMSRKWPNMLSPPRCFLCFWAQQEARNGPEVQI